MSYLDLTTDDVLPDPEQARKTFTGIAELAELIDKYGLLQNLVVKETSYGYMIVAGERRWRALRMLEADGRRDKTQKIMCLVVGNEDGFIQLVENVGRQELAPWDLGRRFLEFIDGGMTQEEVAARSGCSQVKVSQYARIAAFTAPSVIARLARAGPTALTLSELRRLSSVVNRETGEPDEKRQSDLLEKFLLTGGNRKRKIRVPLAGKKRVVHCFRALARGSVHVPERARPVIDAVIAYFNGKTRGIVWPEELE